MTQTILMIKCPDQTLWGYIFTDMDHARDWLKSYGATDKNVSLEVVEVGPLIPCSKCGGVGVHRTVTSVHKISVRELFKGHKDNQK